MDAPGHFPPGILILVGLWAILGSTFLYRPFNRMHDRIDAVYFRWLGWHTTDYHFRSWLRADWHREWTFRGVGIGIGLLLIAIAAGRWWQARN